MWPAIIAGASALANQNGGGGGGKTNWGDYFGHKEKMWSGISGLAQGLWGESGNPYGVAMDAYRNRMNPVIQGFNPYTDAGKWAIDPYKKRIGEMENGVQFNNDIMNQYQQSPYAKFQIEQGIKSANNAASASGMLGSGAEQKALADYSQGVSSRDQQQFFQNAMGTNQQYTSMLQNLMGQGLTAQQAQAQLEAMLAEAEAKAAAGQEQGRINDKNSMIGGFLQFGQSLPGMS